MEIDADGISERQVIDFSYGYNYWHRGTPGWNFPGWVPIYNALENSLEVKNYYYFPQRYNIFNGSIFPSDDAEPFFKIWNYYDHAEIWHKISFKFRQPEDNTLRFPDETIDYLSELTVSIAICDITRLNRNNYPNKVDNISSWQDWTYGRSTFKNGSWHSSSAMELEIHQDSKDEYGIHYGNRSNENYRRWAEWMPIRDINNTHDWVDFEVKLRIIDDDTGESTTCTTCYPVIMVMSNAVQYVINTNLSWAVANLTIERVNEYFDDVIINDFYNELVEIPRMDSLEDAIIDDDNIRINSECPHFWDDYEAVDFSEWHDETTWSNYGNVVPDTSMNNITLPENKTVIIRSCSLVATGDDPYQRVKLN